MCCLWKRKACQPKSRSSKEDSCLILSQRRGSTAMKVKQHPRCNRSNRSSASGSEQLDFRSEPKPPPLYRIKIGSCSTAPGGQAYVIGKTEHFSKFWPVAMKLSGSLDAMQRTAALVHRKTGDSTGVDKNKNNSRRLPSSYPPPLFFLIFHFIFYFYFFHQ